MLEEKEKLEKLKNQVKKGEVGKREFQEDNLNKGIEGLTKGLMDGMKTRRNKKTGQVHC